MVRFVGPYGAGVGLNTLAESVISEQSLQEERLGKLSGLYAVPSLEGIVCLIDTRTQT
jgi:hypothetical protein